MSRKNMAAGLAGNVDASIGATTSGDAPAPARPAKPADPQHDGVRRRKDVASIPVDSIVADPGQPRREFDPAALARLASSLRSKGQLQPIQVYYSADDSKYVIVAGERRWRAAKEAPLSHLACVVLEAKPDEKEIRVIQAMENLLREDLKPVEAAQSMRELIESHGYTQKELAEEMGFQQPIIAKALALLKLTPDVQKQVDAGQISASAAYEITQLESPEEQKEVAAKAVSGKLKRNQVQAEVAKVKERSGTAKPRKGRAPKTAPIQIDAAYNSGGYKILATNRKGVEKPALREVLLTWADQLAPAESVA